ncbi:MAG: helix-turn-helix transcriptional regulator [Clostridia bacterium]|nr:helix-turn-helix transcriptional regulator [Clostridia bacterium]
MNQILTGQFIKQCRKEKGLTQEELAQKLNISPKTISKWECGSGLPEVSLMLPLCNELGISVNELLSGCRIDGKDYRDKAEENLIAALRERKENKKKIILEVIIACISIASGLLFCVLAELLSMPGYLRIILICFGMIVIAAGIAVCCVMDRDAGYYQCSKCKHLFVPSMGAYIAGAHFIGRRQLKCPHCGKISYCKKKLSK